MSKWPGTGHVRFDNPVNSRNVCVPFDIITGADIALITMLWADYQCPIAIFGRDMALDRRYV